MENQSNVGELKKNMLPLGEGFRQALKVTLGDSYDPNLLVVIEAKRYLINIYQVDIKAPDRVVVKKEETSFSYLAENDE